MIFIGFSPSGYVGLLLYPVPLPIIAAGTYVPTTCNCAIRSDTDIGTASSFARPGHHDVIMRAVIQDFRFQQGIGRLKNSCRQSSVTRGPIPKSRRKDILYILMTKTFAQPRSVNYYDLKNVLSNCTTVVEVAYNIRSATAPQHGRRQKSRRPATDPQPSPETHFRRICTRACCRPGAP